MVTEDYVSFETASLLNEKGFDEEVLAVYIYDNLFVKGENKIVNTANIPIIPAPTLQMAMKWLREVHNIFIVIEPHMYDYINEKTSSYVTSLWQGDNYYENITSKDYPTYEEAVETALKYSLEYLI